MTLILWLEVRKLSIKLIIANPNDFIEMKFDLTTIDTLQGLHAYMNTLLSSNEEIMRFCLRKVTHFWGHKEGTYVYYMVAPPWVKTLIVRINSIYLNYRTMSLTWLRTWMKRVTRNKRIITPRFPCRSLTDPKQGWLPKNLHSSVETLSLVENLYTYHVA